ncbi:DciA family protein [Myxococcus sp. Y35]|uniref:DciA family protein n=1 Tax=Pseudomyxococcus flavus TaxID=3115648 RepID=UPI003CF58D53
MARGEPKSLENLLPRVLARLAGESGKGHPLAPVWAAVVGPHLARHTTPQALHGTTLVVAVTGAEWARSLESEAASLCERLNARLGPGTVTALTFTFGVSRR